MLTISKRTKVKVKAATDLKLKMGQNENNMRDSISHRYHAKLPNTVLDELMPGMLPLLYEKGTPKTKPQGELEGVAEAVTLNALTRLGLKMREIHLDDEQTGCNVTIDRGLGDAAGSNYKLTGTSKNWKITLLDGGVVEVEWTFNVMPTDSLDALTLGQLFKMGKRNAFITQEPPKVDTSQSEIEPGATVEPIEGLASAEAATQAAAATKSAGKRDGAAAH